MNQTTLVVNNIKKYYLKITLINKQQIREKTPEILLFTFKLLVTHQVFRYTCLTCYTLELIVGTFTCKHTRIFCIHGSWIYNYLCNQCLSPLK